MGLKSIEVRNWKEHLIIQVDGCKIYSSPVRCPLNFPEVPTSYSYTASGGAYPVFIVYDPEKIETVWFTTPMVEKGEYDWFLYKNDSKIIGKFRASVHGCYKLKKNQRLVVMRKRDENRR